MRSSPSVYDTYVNRSRVRFSMFLPPTRSSRNTSSRAQSQELHREDRVCLIYPFSNDLLNSGFFYCFGGLRAGKVMKINIVGPFAQPHRDARAIMASTISWFVCGPDRRSLQGLRRSQEAEKPPMIVKFTKCIIHKVNICTMTYNYNVWWLLN